MAEIAFRLFAAQGFEQTTVEQIISTAGISRSSFFRYFPTKEDVVTGGLVDLGEQLFSALVERPGDEDPWSALRSAMEPLVVGFSHNPVAARAITKMMTETPSLEARHYEKTLHWQALLVPEVARRLGIRPADPTDPRPQALVAAALGCLDAATKAWAADNAEPDLRDVLDAAMLVVSPRAGKIRALNATGSAARSGTTGDVGASLGLPRR
ncbi:TetR family transcriptional regulator [Microbacterium sp. cf046]|uniref:TetR family transcriptional regulator n=1 Tax=Microbacterium sp. cf046 TaxID=1761803 RepID=UPI0020C8AB3B|nr:TetR family transcriptional regulator [Microbacterium sp. cf046]